MIDKLKNHFELSHFVDKTCCEHEVCITIDETIDENDYIIIKVDNYYNSLNLEKTPPSIDCLIIRKCKNNGFGLTLAELKHANSSKFFDFTNIKAKYETTLFDFIKKRFSDILDLDFKNIELYFVSNKELYRRDLGLKMEVFINLRFKFNGKNLMIIPRMPNPSIKNCY